MYGEPTLTVVGETAGTYIGLVGTVALLLSSAGALVWSEAEVTTVGNSRVFAPPCGLRVVSAAPAT